MKFSMKSGIVVQVRAHVVTDGLGIDAKHSTPQSTTRCVQQTLQSSIPPLACNEWVFPEVIG